MPVEISTYRSRIGLFNPSLKNKKFLSSIHSSSFYENDDQSGRVALSVLKVIFKIVLIMCLILPPGMLGTRHQIVARSITTRVTSTSTTTTRICTGPSTGWSTRSSVRWWGRSGSFNFRYAVEIVSCTHTPTSRACTRTSPGGSTRSTASRWGSPVSFYLKQEENYEIKTEIIDHNFEARSINGNIQNKKGILNMHLNIRSLKNKISEVKRLIKEHNPHMLGLSEVELKKENLDEKSLKIPGYELLFPTSWSKQGFARVAVYVKKTFKSEQILDLQDEHVQTVWIKGGYQKTKDILFCHSYREHLTGQGSGAMNRYMNSFLGQWEAATRYGNTSEPNETHICGDMNIDTLGGRWLQPDYHLAPLSRMIKSVCDTNNFHQLVQDVTRTQYNSVTNTTSLSCIDHIYTNAKFRCSDPVVTSFGDSDHDLIGYVRYSKNPPEPARTICKRSYKAFKECDFIEDVRNTDWTEVYACSEVDLATECFSRKFRYLLNLHAPWVRAQLHKNFAPWLTAETKKLMKQRDLLKEEAKRIARESSVVGPDQVAAWAEYKKYRNKVNNKKKN